MTVLDISFLFLNLPHFLNQFFKELSDGNKNNSSLQNRTSLLISVE